MTGPIYPFVNEISATKSYLIFKERPLSLKTRHRHLLFIVLFRYNEKISRSVAIGCIDGLHGFLITIIILSRLTTS
jgi:hypothetical protein